MEQTQNSGCVIIKDETLLVLWRKKHNHYEIPGGKVESGETLEQTAIRETKEEIGCDVKVIKYLCYKDFHIDKKDFRSHTYLAEILGKQRPKVIETDKFDHVFWLPITRYNSFSVAPNVKDLCEDYINHKLKLTS